MLKRERAIVSEQKILRKLFYLFWYSFILNSKIISKNEFVE